MIETSLNVLKKLEAKGFKAYVVGGFVRDYLLKRKSVDVDISTNATPKEIKEIFPDSFLPNEAYGSITIIQNKIRFEITTFRREFQYYNNRKPLDIEYTNDLYEDLNRRDFTINTLCMNSSGEILDFLNIKDDLEQKKIKTVGNSIDKFTEDALRILRAVRFATVLEFELDEEVKHAINKTKKYLQNISFNRKKQELDRIFMSKNCKYGIELLIELGLDIELEIYNLKDIKISNDLLGIWSSLEVSSKYPFTKAEKDLIDKIKRVESFDNFDKKVLYTYGPYVNSIAAINKGKDNTKVINIYNDLPIKVRSDILITSKEIMELFNKESGKYINEVYKDLEDKILYGVIPNDSSSIREYIINSYLIDR